MSEVLANFHFLRPLWFLGLLPVLAIALHRRWQKKSVGNWQKLINPALLPYLIQGDQAALQPSGMGKTTVWCAAWLLACAALAGPTWQQLPQPVHKQESALILILDLSPSMLAEDIVPSRLVRARYKAIDILAKRNEGYTGLVVYSGSAHVVSPLTEDANTIVSIVPTLTPALMPSYGSQVEEAIESALKLAENAGFERGDLILITDGVARVAMRTIDRAMRDATSYRLSILGVGTAEGAPIPLAYGGFLKNDKGNILVSKLDASVLRELATNNRGIYRSLGNDDNDIDALMAISEEVIPHKTRQLEREFDLWDDRGHWLIFLLLPLIISAFRRGTVVMICLALVPLLYPSKSVALEWLDLWQRRDQQATEALNNGDAQTAQALFEDRQWRASAAYRAGDYASAAEDFNYSDDPSNADAHYNRGNSLAKAGDLEAAVDAYRRALELAPESEDSLHNKQLVEKLLEQQQQQQREEQEQEQDQQSKRDQDRQNDRPDNDASPDDNSDEQQQPADPESQNSPDTPAQQQTETPPEERQQPSPAEPATESPEERQAQQELEQLLRSVPDDPGGLLRAKFEHQARQRANQPRRPSPPNNEASERY